MERTTFGVILNVMTAIGTFAAGIAALYGIVRVLGNIRFKTEVLYGEEAETRLKEIKGKQGNNGQ
jgi:hypothetical protein